MLIGHRINTLNNLVATDVIDLDNKDNLNIIASEFYSILDGLPEDISTEARAVINTFTLKVYIERGFSDDGDNYSVIALIPSDWKIEILKVCNYLLERLKSTEEGIKPDIEYYKQIVEIAYRELEDVSYFDVNYLFYCNDVMEEEGIDLSTNSYDNIKDFQNKYEDKLVDWSAFYNPLEESILEKLQDICREELCQELI